MDSLVLHLTENSGVLVGNANKLEHGLIVYD